MTGAIAWFGELRLLAIAPETVRGALGEATAAVDGTEDSGEEDGGTAVKAGFSDIVGGIGAGVTDVETQDSLFLELQFGNQLLDEGRTLRRLGTTSDS